ncbi:coilin isoform X2 [Syngnathoides biaculeatus]|uniref:coilin isoform X2 n=1 Tax=Syngnathoides biaculeatus TaxID=300417 RepID=UPI002ADD7DD9|nr:coilin isoform X2 [Syngnathoides biaculeatus]
MATHCSNHIRVRLHFDYPPPAVVDCRMCWLLVDLNTCRIVSDLESTIREKFEFSRRSIISLFIEDCYLLHTESIYVVRDNDCLRVKVDFVSHLNGDSCPPNKPSENCKKRQRRNKPENSDENSTCVEQMETKRKKKEILQFDAPKTPGVETNNLKNILSKKKKQKEKGNGLTPSYKPTFSTLQDQTDHPRSKIQDIHQTKSQNTTTSDYCRVQDEVPNKTGTKTDSSKPAKVPHPSKEPPRTSPAKICSSPSSSNKGSSNVNTAVDPWPKNNDVPDVKLRLNHKSCSKLSNYAQKKHSSVSVFPLDQIKMSQESCDIYSGDKAGVVNLQPTHEELNNGAQNAPQDYTDMPLLAAPPQVGQKIAFKLLELTENYTPEVSEYKEGMIVSFDPVTRQIELQLLSASQALCEPGKFDLVYKNPDGTEIVEYAVSRGCSVTEQWDSLLEPRLII